MIRVTVFFPEFLDSSGTINELLFSGEKGMALGAYLNPNILLGGAGFESVATGTGYNAFIIIWMDVFLHISCSLRRKHYSRIPLNQ